MSSTKRAAPEAAGAAAVDERTKRIRKLSPYQHVILKPTMYVGATSVQEHERALLSVRKNAKPADTAASDSEADAEAGDGAAGSPLRPETPAKATIELSARIDQVEFVPALLKIFDEVVTNALDVAVKEKDVRNIAVSCNGNTVTVKNDGSGLPVEFHHEVTDVRVPELIFSHLNTGSNYDDDSERLVAGQNGLGVKLANIFSDSFTVKTRDSKTGDTFEMTWTERMSKTQPAKVKLGKPKKEAEEMDEAVVKKRAPGGFVEVSFSPIAELLAPHGTIAGTVLEELFAARTLDIAMAAPPGVRVDFNGVTLKVPNLKAFMHLFVKKEDVIAVDEHDPNWLVGVALAPKDSNGRVRALVNGVSANEGVHVYHAEHKLYSAVVEAAKSKRELKDVSLKHHQLKARAFLFVVARMTGVTFNSQTKENCTGGNFMSIYHPPELLVKKVLASEIVGEAASAEKTRVARELAKKTDGKKTAKVSVEKLQDAEWAGTARSNRASLILTEGDSARSFAIAGLPQLGFDKYGVFPLRGKLLNTRDASAKQLAENVEITNLKKILGLKEGCKHEDGEGLRYGSVIILTDSDAGAAARSSRENGAARLTHPMRRDAFADGSHIRGLILNFLHFKWPELAKSGFVSVMATPIVRAKKVRKHSFGASTFHVGKIGGFYHHPNMRVLTVTTDAKTPTALIQGASIRDFYNLNEFNTWTASGANAGWRIKYYKGLGTWTQGDAKTLLSTTPAVKLLGDDDDDDSMALAFDKRKTDDRKQWILNSVAAPPVPDYTTDMTISDFVNTDLVNFSRYNTERSLPSMLDGLKTSQRKILFTVLKRNYIGVSREVKVAQLSGAVAELTLYLHGEQSLNDAIVSMGQDFVGSNNLPLLFPDGAFGTRLGTRQGTGKDAASPRYIYTYAQDVTRLMFKADDDALLPLKKEEGFDVEPEAYWPVLPMLLINGCVGIGTGYSTSVPMFSPTDVKANVLRFLDGEDLENMTPSFKGFKGEVVNVASGKWAARGVATRDDERVGRVRITELPPDTSFIKYEELLGDEKSPVTLVQNKSSDVAADFLVDYKSGVAPEDADKLLAELKLVQSISSSNMYAFDEHGSLKKYQSAEELMREWCAWRQIKYEVRRAHMVATLEQRALVARNKSRFVKAVATQKLVLGSMEESALCELFRNKDFKEIDGGYDYLLNMGARSFTSDRAAALQASADAAEAEAQRMRETTAQVLWREDLARLRF